MTQDQGTHGLPAEPHVEPAVPAETAPEEIEHDALSELDRIHQAQRFGAAGEDWMSGGALDPGYGMSTPVGSVSHAYDPAAASEERHPRVPVSRELRTLEDLYDAYPEIGGGSHLLRVFRKRPTTWQGFKIDGWLEDVHEQMSMAEFSARFGGGLYEVSVCGPGRAVALESDGRVHSRTLTTIQINIQGQPVVSTLGRDGEERMTASYHGREDPRLSLRKLDLEADRERRREAEEKALRRELAGQRAIDPALLKTISELADQRGRDTKSLAAETIAQLKDDRQRLHASNEAKDKQLQELREKVLEVQSQAANRWREEESRQIRELKDRHELELRNLKDHFGAEIKRMQEQHANRVEELTKQATRERDQLQQAETRERDKIREDAARREKQLQDDNRTQIENMRLSYESRLTEMERVHDRELRNLREDRDRNIQGVQLAESTKATLAEKTALIQTSVINDQLTRTQSELNAAKREIAELRAQNQPKDVMTTIREAHELTAMTQGAAEKEEGEFDWKRGLFNALQGIVEKAPEIAENLGKAREENRQTVERLRQQMHGAVGQHGRQGMQPGMPGMPQHPGVPRRVAPPAPPMGIAPHAWDGSMGPPDPSTPIGVPPAPPWPPMADMSSAPLRAHHIGSPPPSAPSPPPANRGPVVPMEASPAQPEPIQGVQPATEAQEPSVHSDDVLQVTEEQVGQFTEQLEAAIATDVVTPKQFAERFVEEVGLVGVREILSRMGPDQLVNAVQAQPGLQESHIVTRKGRKFVRQLWMEAAQIVR